MFNHVGSCSFDFEGSQKYSVDKIKFPLCEMLRHDDQPFCGSN